jgi:hypothetical protein
MGTMRHKHLQASMIATALATTLLGCGAKSGLTVPEIRFDGGLDAPIPLDAPPRDTPPDAFVPPPDECVELPPREPPEFIDVTFISRVSTADVYFLVDVTGSMGDEIEQIRSSLRDVLIPGIAAEIDNVHFAVGYYADFPAGDYGAPTDEVFGLLAPSTDNATLVQDAVDRLALQSGGDGPESTTEALYLSAVGSALGRFVPSRRCPDRTTVGYPCFRTDGSRIFLVFTDAPFHNGPFGANPYDPERLGITAHTYNETVTALRSIGGKVLGLYSGGGDPEGLSHLQALARDTGAVRPDGSPIVFDIGFDGGALGASVVEAIRTLVDEVPIDIDVLTEDDPTDDLDALMFVERVQALSAVPASGATMFPDRFDNVLPGTEVTFRIFLANELIERGEEPLRYRLQVVLRGDGVTRLKTTIVEVVIPSLDGIGCEVP